MSIHSNIIRKLEETSIYPNKNNAFMCEVLYNDNAKRNVIIKKETVDLNMYLKSVAHKLTKTEVQKLKDLIDSYGELKYSEGGLDESVSHDGDGW